MLGLASRRAFHAVTLASAGSMVTPDLGQHQQGRSERHVGQREVLAEVLAAGELALEHLQGLGHRFAGGLARASSFSAALASRSSAITGSVNARSAKSTRRRIRALSPESSGRSSGGCGYSSLRYSLMIVDS